MYRKRLARQSPGLLQKQEDFELSGVASTDSAKYAQSVTKFQTKGQLENLSVDEPWPSTTPPDACDVPVPGARANKTKPHHRRTASRVLDDAPVMNPVFEQADEAGRVESCPRLGSLNWFDDNGVDYWEEVVDEVPKQAGLLEAVALEGCIGRNARSAGVDTERSAGGCGGRSAIGGAVQRSTRRGNDGRFFPAAPSFPWSMFFYFIAVLACSVAVEVVADRGQRAMACGASVGETRDLTRRLQQSQAEMLDRVASMGMLLSNQVLENHQLREELVEAHRLANYLQQRGRLNVERDSQGADCSAEEGIDSPPANPLEKFKADVHRAVWRLRYHVARLIGYIRKGFELPVGSAMYRRLKWLENVVVGPIE